MHLSETGRRLIKSFEGLRLDAYPDGVNADGSPRYSIGYGHNGVQKGAHISPQQAESLFLSDVNRFETAVANLVTNPITTQDQFDALVSLAWNIGEFAKGLAGSTLLRLHNDSLFREAAAEFGRWVHSGGVVSKTLVARREQERALYERGLPFAAPPEPDTRPPVAAAGVGVLFFCPSCGASCVAKLEVERGI